MDNLTAFESGLLEQFRKLAAEFEQSQKESGDLSQQLSKWSRVISTRQHEIEERLTQIEATQKRLSDALASSSRSTADLVRQVNALLNESES